MGKRVLHFFSCSIDGPIRSSQSSIVSIHIISIPFRRLLCGNLLFSLFFRFFFFCRPLQFTVAGWRRRNGAKKKKRRTAKANGNKRQNSKSSVCRAQMLKKIAKNTTENIIEPSDVVHNTDIAKS